MKKITERSLNKFLSRLITYPHTFTAASGNRAVVIDQEFYAFFPHLTRKEIDEHINILNSRGVISTFPMRYNSDRTGGVSLVSCLSLKPFAFDYINQQKKESRRFWLPIIISIAITTPGAYREELAQLIQALLRLLKLLTAN